MQFFHAIVTVNVENINLKKYENSYNSSIKSVEALRALKNNNNKNHWIPLNHSIGNSKRAKLFIAAK